MDTSSASGIFENTTGILHRPPRTRRPMTKPPHLFTLENYYRRHMHVYYGIVSPAISCFVIALNILLIITLIKGKFRRSTHVMITAIAIADILTGIIPLPFSIYIFSLERRNDYLTVPWCYIYDYMVKYFSEILHLTSLHLTVGLGIERFIVIAYPLQAKTICRMKNGIIFSVVIFVISVIVQCDLFTLTSFKEVSRTIRNRTVIGCLRVPKIRSNNEYIVRQTFLIFVPCVILIVFTILLVKTSKEIQKWREQHSSETTKSLERLDLTVVLMMSFIVVKETVIALMLILSRVKVLRITDTYEEMGGIAAIVYQATSPVNLVILFTLSSNFREKFKELFCCWFYLKKKSVEYNSTTLSSKTNDKTHIEDTRM